MRPALKELVIVGGGSAGWMTAAALSSLLKPKDVSITLIESEQIGIVGVGEATIPDILNFNRILGLKENEFMAATNGTIKLGIHFINWARQGDSYFHQFGEHGVDMQGIDFHQYWLHSRNGGNDNPIEEYNLSWQAAKQNKFMLPSNDPRSVMSQIRYAYHFDAALYAAYLRKYAEARGVRRVEGKVTEVLQDGESGYITGVKMEDETIVGGELFFDCTGFRSLLLSKTLGIEMNDWRHWLPCDTALALSSENPGRILPYTRATAKKSGWQWRIPTQKRTGNGHIFCREFMSVDEATQVLFDGLDGQALTDPREIRFVTGHRQRFWEKNCVAIGLSAGFLEPLESTSIYLSQQGISRFISLYPDASLPDVVRDEYNRFMTQDFEQVRDFIILHYNATERDDSEFWNYCRTMSIPESLQRKIDLFREAGRAFRYEEELFARPSWVAVFTGQRILPWQPDSIVAALPREEVTRSIESMRTAMENAASKMPTHEEFLQRYCPAPAA